MLLTYIIHPEDGQYAAYCRELGTASCGDTVEEARAALEDAVRLHLDTLEELGMRTRYFRERGIKVCRTLKPKAAPVDVLPDQWATRTRVAVAA